MDMPGQRVGLVAHPFPQSAATAPVADVQDNNTFQVRQLYSLTVQLQLQRNTRSELLQGTLFAVTSAQNPHLFSYIQEDYFLPLPPGNLAFPTYSMFIIVQELQQVNCFNQSHQRHPFCQAQLFFSGLILLSVLVSTDKADPPLFLKQSLLLLSGTRLLMMFLLSPY